MTDHVIANQIVLNGIRAIEAPLMSALGSGADDPVLRWCGRWRVEIDQTPASAAQSLEWISSCVYHEYGAPAGTGWRSRPARDDLGPLYAAADQVLRAALDVLEREDDDTLIVAMNRVMEATKIVVQYQERVAASGVAA